MKKNVVLTVAMTMVAVLICVGFGFHLGAKQAANVDYLTLHLMQPGLQIIP